MKQSTHNIKRPASGASAADIRQKFLDYFSERDHRVVDSSPVIPFDDPTLLFTNAGMNQFKKVFTGEESAAYPRAASSQKCMRAGGKHNDLENVGFTTRHHTFFEMLGNFSFGDYFKEQAIVYAWELLTKEFGLDPARLYATVYEKDDEAFDLWAKVAPELKDGRLLRFGKTDNFWAMGDVGPCGPCSEIHYDRGERFGPVTDTNCINGDGERFVEIWNLVFMQYNQPGGGREMEPLPKGSVDTGAGLERWACILQDRDSNYDIDLFTSIIAAIEDVTKVKYDSGVSGVSHRVIADHLRALCFSIADGGGISNEKQGYVLRRILRRAARHGRKLGVSEPFIYRLVSALVDEMGHDYSELREKREHITRVIKAEEESFGRTLETGLKLFEREVLKLAETGAKVIPGEVVFNLYDTHGFPADLTDVMARERGLTIDGAGFEKEMAKQRARARAAGIKGVEAKYKKIIDQLEKECDSDIVTDFIRDQNTVEAIVLRLGELVLLLDRTPFYVEAGGQVSDEGTITVDSKTLTVSKLEKRFDRIYHVVLPESAQGITIPKGTNVTASINAVNRYNIRRNHTATHLLHAALRETLGNHVKQAGSLVSPEKLRFDFSHFQSVTDEELQRIQATVYENITRTIPIIVETKPLAEAQEEGAMALFGEKYGDMVRVVTVPEVSQELCGGTHVENTGEIGFFIISSENGISSGVRRIEALTGDFAYKYINDQKFVLDSQTMFLKVPFLFLFSTVKDMADDIKRLQKENKELKAMRFTSGGETIGTSEKVGQFIFYWNEFGKVDREAITNWADSFKTKDEPAVSGSYGIIDDKPQYMFSSAQPTIALGLDLNKAFKQLNETFGSRGGGKKNFAQGTAPADVSPDEFFTAFKKILEEINS